MVTYRIHDETKEPYVTVMHDPRRPFVLVRTEVVRPDRVRVKVLGRYTAYSSARRHMMVDNGRVCAHGFCFSSSCQACQREIVGN